MEQEEEQFVRDQLIIAVAKIVTDQVRDIAHKVCNLKSLILVTLLGKALKSLSDSSIFWLQWWVFLPHYLVCLISLATDQILNFYIWVVESEEFGRMLYFLEITISSETIKCEVEELRLGLEKG